MYNKIAYFNTMLTEKSNDLVHSTGDRLTKSSNGKKYMWQLQFIAISVFIG
jgi:hypothetical protein